MASCLIFLLLLVLSSAALSSSPSCVCTRSECEEVREWECPGGGVVWDACGCCRVCARVEDEPCGGPDGFHGSCAPGLHCVLEVLLLPPPHHRTTEARGTCKRAVLDEGAQPTAPGEVATPTGGSSRRPPEGRRRWPSKRRTSAVPRPTSGPNDAGQRRP